MAQISAGERALQAGAGDGTAAAQLARTLHTAAALGSVGAAPPAASAPGALPGQRFCTACGTPAPAGGRFCGHCAAPLPP